MLFRINFDAAVAVYRQLIDQVCHAAAAGTLKPREPLPAIRALASQLHLNRNTVAKAYTELESIGVIKTIPGKGCFIEPVNTPFTPRVRQKLLATRIDAALVTAHQLQIDAAAFSALVAERIKLFKGKTVESKETPSEDQISAPRNTPSESIPMSNPLESWTPLTD